VLPDKNDTPIGQPRPLIEFAALFVPPNEGNTVTVYPSLLEAGLITAGLGTMLFPPLPDDEHPLTITNAKIEAITRFFTQPSSSVKLLG
jgi:hypothetical protein